MSQLVSEGERPTLPGYPSADSSPAMPGEKPELVFGVRDWAAVACASGLALWWCAAVDDLMLSSVLVLCGGFALTVAILGFFACALALRGRGLRLTRGSALMLAAVVALACVPAVTSDSSVRACNALVLAAACMLEYLLLSGCSDDVALRASGALSAVGFFLRSQFAHLTHPLRALVRSGRGRAGERRAALLSVIAACAVLCVVLPLLMRADAIFGRDLERVFSWMGDDFGTNLVRLARFVLVTLVASSLLVSLVHGEGACTSAPSVRVHAASVAAVLPALVILDAVYLAFDLIQCGYLFGGARVSDAVGGYATYARSGFFELVAVAAINVFVLLVTLQARRDAPRSRAVDVAQLALLALTLVMDASAAWRMGLYIHVFGLSELRAFTLLGMVAIAVVVVLCAVRVLSTRFPLYPVALGFLLALWCAFALSGVDARVASFDVDGYLSGSIETIDVDYLASLSDDALPALERLANEDSSMTAEVSERLRERDVFGDVWSGVRGRCWATDSLPGLLTGR